MIVIPPIQLTIPDDIIYTNVDADLVPPATPEEEMRYQMFVPLSNQLTSNQSQITVQIKPTQTWDTIMLFNVGADLVEAQITSGPIFSYSETIRYPEPFGSLVNKPNIFIITPEVDPIIYPEATLVVNLKITSATVPSPTSAMYRPAHCEFLAVGRRNQIGMTCYGTTLGIMDFSRKDREFDGSITLIERGYADTVAFKFELETSAIADVREFLADLRAKPCGYIGNINEPATYIMGLYRDFTIPIESYTWSQAEIQVESVVRTGVTPIETIGLQAVFIDSEASVFECLESVEQIGVFNKLYLSAEGDLGEQSARVIVPLGREPLPEEVLEWTVVWGEPETPIGSGEFFDPSLIAYDEKVISTSCGEWVAVLEWPAVGGTTDKALLPNIANISLSFTDASQTTLTSNSVTLIVDYGLADCTSQTTTTAWWNPSTEKYDLVTVYGAVDNLAITVTFPTATETSTPLDFRALACIFDSDYYLATNPDIRAAIAAGQFESAFLHYFSFGEAENRKPNPYFDPAYYKTNNPSVVAETYPNTPTHFNVVLQHYQTFGYSEGRLPCNPLTIGAQQPENPEDPIEITTMPVVPVGSFFWTGIVDLSKCTGSACNITWDWNYTGESPPSVVTAKNTVSVFAGLHPSTSELIPVSPGILTLTPSIQCPAEADGLPIPEPVVLNSIQLVILQFISGWDIGSGYSEILIESESLTGTWTAGIEGDLTECLVSWGVKWSGDNLSLPTFTNDPVLGTLQVSNVTVAGIVEAQATVTGRHGSVTLEKIYLKLGNYVAVPPLISCPNPLWLNGTNTEVGFVEEIQEIV